MGRHIVGASQRLAGRQIPSEFGSALKIKRRVGAIPQELQGVDSANKHISMLLKSKKNSQKTDGMVPVGFLLGSGVFLFWLCLTERKQLVQFFHNALLFGQWRKGKP